MQLLADSGEEGSSENNSTLGLGLISGNVVSLKKLKCNERVPHVGWNSVHILRKNSLFNDIYSGADFYFVHSFAFVPTDKATVIATSDYGIEFCAVVARKNVWGTQFHPEKSSRVGFKLLKNFRFSS